MYGCRANEPLSRRPSDVLIRFITAGDRRQLFSFYRCNKGTLETGNVVPYDTKHGRPTRHASQSDCLVHWRRLVFQLTRISQSTTMVCFEHDILCIVLGKVSAITTVQLSGVTMVNKSASRWSTKVRHDGQQMPEQSCHLSSICHRHLKLALLYC